MNLFYLRGKGGDWLFYVFAEALAIQLCIKTGTHCSLPWGKKKNERRGGISVMGGAGVSYCDCVLKTLRLEFP